MRFIFLVFVALSVYPDNGSAAKKVLLSSVKTMTLHSDKFTTGRRSSPIPQLQCVDGKSSCKSLPSAVQCYNMGSDGMDVQWKCEAQLPNNAQFDNLQVQCEGYDYPDDPYILAGSCGLTYTLKPVGSGGSGSGGSSRSHKHHRRHSSSSSSHSSYDGASGYSNFAVVAVFLVAGYAVYAFCLAPRARDASQAQPSAPGYDADDTQPPPPPYSESDQHRQPPQYGFRTEYTDNRGGANKYATYNEQQQQQAPRPQATPERDDSGRPGFWTGAALGGVAGYLFGNSGSNSSRGGGSHYRRDDYYDSQRSSCYQDNRGSGGGATYSSSSSSASDETPVTRTGYASTRRR